MLERFHRSRVVDAEKLIDFGHFSYPVFFNEQELYELDWDNESTIESVLLMRRAKR